MGRKPAWYKFQEDLCDYFNSLGTDAKTNQRVDGVRTHHDIDVLVKTKYLGENLTWVVEAKKWKTKVSKLHVLALRTIIDDIGADKGFIISEVGFQGGAIKAANNTNVILKTFDELKITTKDLIEVEVLKSYKNRIRIIENRYWAHSKKIRQKYGLRGEVFDYPLHFSGYFLLNAIKMAIVSALHKDYPIDLDTGLVKKTGELTADNFQQLINWLNLNFNMLDSEIITAEVKMIENDDFHPHLKNEDEMKEHIKFDLFFEEETHKLN